jgi:hypothetical protein
VGRTGDDRIGRTTGEEDIQVRKAKQIKERAQLRIVHCLSLMGKVFRI